MDESIYGIARESYLLFVRMAPFLVFGYFIAGILHVFLKPGSISSHLGKDDLWTVIKASLFGAPLPLCSCGVIPTAISLRKEGASKGAVLSFLISTPTTGVDSILATYSLLGPFFTFYRIAASLVTGIFSGSIANRVLQKDSGHAESRVESAESVNNKIKPKAGKTSKIKGAFKYAYIDLIRDTGPALIMGIVAGGAISFLLPSDIVESHMGFGLYPMIIMLLAALPMYVCATSSVPIAAALMFKGLAPGAAFVFLVAGPATNIVTMSVVSKNMGKKALGVYLSSIIISSLAMGGILNLIWRYLDFSVTALRHDHGDFLSGPAGNIASVFLFSLILIDLVKRLIKYSRFIDKSGYARN